MAKCDIFTPAKKEILQQNWKTVAEEVTPNIFETAWTATAKSDADIKAVFSLGPDDPIPDEVVKGFVYMQGFFEKLIIRLDYDQKNCLAAIDRLGRRHVDFKLFRPEFWDKFAEKFDQTVDDVLKGKYTDDQKRNELKSAWSQFVHAVVAGMKASYAARKNEEESA